MASANAANLLVGFDNAAAAVSAERARRVADPLDNPAIDAYVSWAVSQICATDRRFDDALRWNQEAAEAAELSGNRFVSGNSTMNIALHARRAGRDPLRAHEESLNRLYADRNWLNIWPVLESLAMQLMETGSVEAAGVLLGHIEANHLGSLPRTARRTATIRTLNQHSEAQEWMTRGAQLDRHHLVAYAFDTFQSQPR
jgi:hypothetical protein